MAVAVKTSPAPEPKAAAGEPRLLSSSLFGAVYVLLGIAIVSFGVPQLWLQGGVGAWVETQLGTFVNVALRALTQLLVGGVWWWLGMRLAGSRPPLGIRGGITLTIAGLVTLFFLGRAAGLIAQRSLEPATAQIVFAVAGVVFLAAAARAFRSAWFRQTAISLDEQGWFRTGSYKRNQGVRVRRLTMLGLLVLLGSGVFSLMNSALLVTSARDWVLELPFTDFRLTLLPELRYTLPLLLLAASLWLAYRLVNLPQFADFLVATEAEMNKVSWSSRKQLIRDTITVLITVFLLTMFLLLVDLFWGWVLSREVINVLPSSATKADQPGKSAGPQQQPW